MTRLSSKAQKWLFSLLLALVTLAVYWPVRHNGFINYDDDDYVYANDMVRGGLSWAGLAWAFMGMHAANWHPLTWLSHMLDCQLFGLDAGAHHLVSVAIHCANAVLLLWLLESLTGKFWRCAFLAALFALHPLRVESVAWVAERKDVLSSFFFLLTLLMYVRHVRGQTQGGPSRPGIELRLALLFYLLALLSKPMVVTLPLILLLLDWWPLQRFAGMGDVRRRMAGLGAKEQFSAEAAREDARPTGSGANMSRDLSEGSVRSPSAFMFQLHEKWPFFLLSIIFSAITLWAQHSALPAQPGNPTSLFENMILEYLGYIQLILWPQNLSFLYVPPGHVSGLRVLVALLVVGSISLWAWVNLRRRPWAVTGWLWFLVMLLPVTAVRLPGLFIADRYTYLPGIGFCALLVWGVAEVTGNLPARRAVNIFLGLAGMAVLLVCAGLTRQQIGYWHDTQTLLEHALKMDPNNPVAQINLRVYLFEQAHPGVREGRKVLSNSTTNQPAMR